MTVSLAAYFHQANTLLIDIIFNRPALNWASGNHLPMAVKEEQALVVNAYEHSNIDLSARMTINELKTVMQRSDLLVLPTPDDLSFALRLMLNALKKVQFGYCILLTLISSSPRIAEEARAIINNLNLPIFQDEVRCFGVFQKAVPEVLADKDKNAFVEMT